MVSSGVQVLVSAFGINLRLFGVSSVAGRIATTVDVSETPLLLSARLLTSW